MEQRGEPAPFNSDYGCNTPICEEDLNDDEQLPYLRFSQGKQQASIFSLNPEQRCRLAAALLTLLAVVLLIVNIGLGVHYSELKDSHLTLDDTKLISRETDKLRDSYRDAVENTTAAKKLLDREVSRQKEGQWELQHQTDRSHDYTVELEKVRKDIDKMAVHLPTISNGCKYCPAGWILMNSVCYYFAFSNSDGVRPWQKAREFCQVHEGDLITLDSKEKENATVTYLLQNHNPSDSSTGYWIGLKDSEEEDTWKWMDGTALVEGYWKQGEPNNANNEDCAAVYATENFFRAWNDNRCSSSNKWICEKTPTSFS